MNLKSYLVSAGLLATAAPLFVLNTTQLYPENEFFFGYGLYVSFAIALITAAYPATKTSGDFLDRSLQTNFAYGALAGLLSFPSTVAIENLIKEQLAFPANQTQTFEALIPIDIAERARGRGTTYVLQPIAYKTTLNISMEDYNTIIEDVPNDPEFKDGACAKVTMQRSGDALQVLHAGLFQLPSDIIVKCPPEAKGKPYLEIPGTAEAL